MNTYVNKTELIMKVFVISFFPKILTIFYYLLCLFDVLNYLVQTIFTVETAASSTSDLNHRVKKKTNGFLISLLH